MADSGGGCDSGGGWWIVWWILQCGRCRRWGGAGFGCGGSRDHVGGCGDTAIVAVLENAVSYQCKLPDKSPSKNEQAQQKSIPLTLSFLAGVGSRSEVRFLVFDMAHVPLLARDDGDCTSVGAAVRKDNTVGTHGSKGPAKRVQFTFSTPRVCTRAMCPSASYFLLYRSSIKPKRG